MINPYKKYLIVLFEKIIDIRHSSNRISSVLNNDVKKYTTETAIFSSFSSLIISDWTEPTDKGWEINFHTGVSKATEKEDYAKEVSNIISRQCCLAFAQSFEALETFLKDCIYENHSEMEREKIPGGDKLFKLIKKTCGKEYQKFSENNNKKLPFKGFWKIISDTRHAITHSNCRIHKSKLEGAHELYEIFEYLFDYENTNGEIFIIRLDYKKLDRLLKHVSEFAYQIFKLISTEKSLGYKIT